MTLTISRRFFKITAVIIMLVLVCIGVFRLTGYISIRALAAQTHHQGAYTLWYHVSGSDKTIYAQRQNGDKVILRSSVFIPDSGYIFHQIHLTSVGLYIQANDILKHKFTNELTAEEIARKKSGPAYNAHSECVQRLPSKDSQFVVEGVEQVLGIDTFRIAMRNRRMNHILWRAPSIDCAQLKSLSQELDESGNVVKSSETLPDKIEIGEPNPSLFAVDDYKETLPSETELAWGRHFGFEPPKAMLDRWREIDKKIYHPHVNLKNLNEK